MMNEKHKDNEVPRLHELFIVAVQQVLELAKLLKLSHDDFLAMMEMSWQRIEQLEREDHEASNKENVK
jgi:hypothetical protein